MANKSDKLKIAEWDNYDSDSFFTVNRNWDNLGNIVTALFNYCKVRLYDDRGATCRCVVSRELLVDYKGVSSSCADVLYTKLRAYSEYNPRLDDLELTTELTINDDGDISLSWRRDDLDNLLAVTNFKNGHTIRSFLLKAGFSASKGRLTHAARTGVFSMLREMNFTRALPCSAEYLETEEFLKGFRRRKAQLRQDYYEQLHSILATWKGRPLMKHQVEYLEELAKLGDLQCNFSMGLGKTFTSLMLLWILYRINSNVRLFVITKSSIMSQWRQENYDTVKLPIEFVSWNKIPEQHSMGRQDYIVVADESHYTQSVKTKRTQAYEDFCSGALMVVNLTGTPFKNGRLKDAQASLSAMGVLQYDKWGAFEDYDMFKEMYSQFFYYRHKDDCIDLPDKTRVKHDVEFTKAQQLEVKNAYIEFMKLYEERANDGKVSLAAAHLVALQVLRKLLAFGKKEYALEVAQELLDEGQQVVIFCDFLEPLQFLYNNLTDVVWLQSKDSSDVRGQKQAKFQSGEARVFISTYKCGGVGINLTPCTNIITIDRPWTPADVEQAEDRCHRIGQKDNLTVHNLYYYDDEGIESKVENILAEKQENINFLLDANIDILE